MARPTSLPLGDSNVCGRRIRAARIRHHPPITQFQMVDCLAMQGVLLDRTSLSRIENQQRSLTDTELVALAKCLHTTVAYLIGETNKYRI